MKLNVVEGEAWYSEGLRFSCTQCGNCCTGGPGFVWITAEEISRLAAFLKMGEEEVIERYCRKIGGRHSLNEHRNARGEYDCVFLHEEPAQRSEKTGEDAAVVHGKRTCTIYEARPLQCRTWPFWEGNLADEAGWERGKQRCPGMGRGKRFEFEQIEAMRTAGTRTAGPGVLGRD